MKNSLIFFYSISVNEIKKINNNYYFLYQNNNYIISFYDRHIDEVFEIYKLNEEMLEAMVPVYRIVLTKNNSILFEFEKKYYILMLIPNIKNRLVCFNDLYLFNYLPKKKYKLLDKSNWNVSWSNKIDYIENQFSQLQNKYSIIKESINYYIGIWENGISYSNLVNINKEKFVSHKRITIDTDLLYFYNPLNIIIDFKERNIVDYLKSYIFENNWTIEELQLYLNKATNLDSIKIISRSFFPSNYFDLYEDILLDNKEEKELLEIIDKRVLYEKYLKYLLNYYNNIPIVEWITKKD